MDYKISKAAPTTKKTMAAREIATKAYLDQKSGTAGLRKKVAVFQQPHYLENYLQSVFDCVPELKGRTLVLGGDGRHHNRAAIQPAIAIAAGNGVQRVIVGQGGLLSTPAASQLNRLRKAAGGFILTASHNQTRPKKNKNNKNKNSKKTKKPSEGTSWPSWFIERLPARV